MEVRQTRIFVPPLSPYDGVAWAETLVGCVVAPLVASNDELEWFWFSRYVQPRSDSGDCDINVVPEDFGIDQEFHSVGERGFFRSLRFRYSLDNRAVQAFEDQARELIADQGCVISDFREYDHIGDLGGNKFLGGERSDERRVARARLMEQYLCSVCQICIHCLVGPDKDGRFKVEESDSQHNPLGSIFESAHHLFCNITAVPLRVLISQQGVGTDWSPPGILQGGTVTAYRVKF